MKQLPQSVKPYRQTPEFNEQTLPQKLQRAHTTKRGTWGRIRVLKGKLRYRILTANPEEHELNPSTDGIIEPETPHEVKAPTPVRFYVEFFR